MSKLISAQRDLGRRSFREFMRMAWPLVEPNTPYMDNWHIGAVAEHLEAVYRAEIRNLLIEEPPGCMKSKSVCVLWPTWCWIQDPSFAFIFGSFDATLTYRDAGQALGLIQSKWFRDRWGDRVVLKKNDPAVGDYETVAGGFRFATSVGGKGTGRHANCVVFDDPIKPQTLTKASMEDAERWWKSTMATRKKVPKTHRRVGIMQRLHENDLAGVCERDGYQVLRLTMRYEPGWSWPGDPRTVPGELLWPERHTEEVVRQLEVDLGSRGSAAQLQQRPAPEGGLVFKREWFRRWRGPLEAPPTDTSVTCVALPDTFDQVWQSWDCAFKGTDTSDFVCGQIWARKGADFFLLDQVMLRLDFPGTLAAVRAMTKKWPRAMTKLVEDKANGSAVISSLQKEVSGLLAVNPEGGKEARANAVAPLHEAGNVYYPLHAPWVDAHIDNMATFPTAAHDDDVDAETQALTFGYRRKNSWSAAMDVVAKGATVFHRPG